MNAARRPAPKNAEGRLDHNAALTGDDLRDFVDGRLLPYLAGFKQRASGPNTIEYKIGEVFVRGKLTALDELKQSPLHQAFSGAL